MAPKAFTIASLAALILTVPGVAHPLAVANSTRVTEQKRVPEERFSSEGEWVGGFQIGKRLSYMRIQILTEPQGTTIRVLSAIPGGSGTISGLRLEPPVVRFNLRSDADELSFDGKLRGGTISGTVGGVVNRGTFEFKRIANVNPNLYDRYAGAYEFGRDRVVYIRRADRLKADPPSSVEKSWLYFVEESGRTGILWPSSETAFFSGPSHLVPTPTELEVNFIPTDTAGVDRLMWHRKGRSQQIAKISKLYTEEDVTFHNGLTTLAGTLLLPATKGPHPAIALIAGAGPSNRNQGYAIVADIFARHGIAALIYDKRGTGRSGGDWHVASFEDLADDALAGVDMLRRRKDINAGQVGLWGISEGGYVAPLAASRSEHIAFLVLVSASALPEADAELRFIERSMRADGAGTHDIEEALAFSKLEREFAISGTGWESLAAARRELEGKKWFGYTWTGIFGATSSTHWSWEWYRRRAAVEPETVLTKITCPVLAIWGGRDVYGGEGNKAAFEKALRKGGNKSYAIRIFANGNHTLGLEEPGGDLYWKTYVPEYFEAMTGWLLRRVNLPK